MQIHFLFESKHISPTRRDYVGVMSDSALVSGRLASQNAGSSNFPIYYQVGGGGLNRVFELALGPAETAVANTALVAEYDARYGAGAWQQDKSSGVTDRLTSFYVPVDASEAHRVGPRAVAMMYSVGPVLTGPTIVDTAAYAQIYADAMEAVLEANAGGAGVEALRITMLSTGIYAAGVPEAQLDALYEQAAALILDGIEAAAKAAMAAGTQAHLPRTVLINTEADSTSTPPKDKEIGAFTPAATKRGLTVNPGVGFDLDVPET